MNITLTGTHGVGKTTLANELHRKLNIKLISGISRQKIDEGNRSYGKIASFDFQYGIMNSLGQKLIVENYRKNSFISDRSIFDVLAYSLLSSKINNKEKKSIEGLFNLLLSKKLYDYVFLVPKMFDMEADGYRDVDDKYQEDIEKKIIMLFKTYKITYHKINSFNLQDRVNEVLDFIKNNNVKKVL